MLFHTTESVQAEITYRQERLRRDFQRPGWLRRSRAEKADKPVAKLHLVPSRHAM
ncbi:hypothetical protein Kfla_6253 [Kribbella flavida DSM 17836]|uniref:Uncharacterized protein n=1 Tax=Kribbella flavida (strain DSM 17836 / JCM 10339 / NBRC 14399) TaxID=479435 RepID=D2PVL6_KRIFD|nr:hypothetical protein [Kribbella flavida]ADB35256.1 hypothetical protein Kfla_6253 [Kribbella flavida DSM 17836]